jgi:hypothetical protein
LDCSYEYIVVILNIERVFSIFILAGGYGLYYIEVDYDSVWYMRQDSYQEHNTANQRNSLFLSANEGQPSRFLCHNRQPEAFYLLCQSERGSRILAAYEKHSFRDSFSQQGARSFTPDSDSQSERGPRMLSANEKHSS